ncbi:hypothetical protein MMC18_005185 [Xylographa bjoerkii]|nr:hypothetical protein [Xylographa bjoerkii]
MEKIKNMLNPGSKHDNEVLYGSGQSSDPMHSGTSAPGTGFAQGHTLGHLEEGGRPNEAFSTSNNNSTTGTTATDDPFLRNATSAQRPGLSSDVGSTTAIRDGVPGATSGSGLSGSTETDVPVARDPNTIGGFAKGHTLGHLEKGGRRNDLFSSDNNPTSASTTSSTGRTERDTALASGAGTSAYETDRRLNSAGQAAGSTASSAGQSTLQNDETTASSGLTGNTYPDRSVGRQVGEPLPLLAKFTSTTYPSTTDKIREVASGRGEEGLQENLGSSLTERESPLGGNSTAGTGIDGPTSSTTSNPSHLERDATLGGAAVGGAGLAEHEHAHHRDNGDATGTESSIDPCGPGAEPAAPHFVPGPHVTDTANRLDPHVDTPGYEPSHPVPAAALPGSAGTAATTYEANEPRGTTGLGADPVLAESEHKPSLMDRLAGKNNDTAPTSNVEGVGSTGSTTREPTMFQDTGFGPSTGHDKERDTALSGGVGAAAYEADRPHGSTTGGLEHDTVEKQRKPSLISRLLHPGKHDSENVQGTGSGSSTPIGHHKERDAALAGGVGGIAYEADRRHGSTASAAGRKASTASGMNLGMDPGASDVQHNSALLNTLDPRVAQESTSDAGYAAVEHPPVVDETGHTFGVADSGGMQGRRVIVPYEENVPPLYKHDGGAYTDEEKYGKKGAAIRHGSTATGAESAATEEKQRKPSIFSRLDPRKKSNTPQTNAVEGVEDTAVTDPSSGHEYRATDAGGMQGNRVAVPYESNAAPLYKHDGGAYTDEEKFGGAAVAGAGATGVGYEAEKHERDSKGTTTPVGTGTTGATAVNDPKVTGVYTPLEATGPESYRHDPETGVTGPRAPGLTSPNDSKVTGVYTPLEANGPPSYRHNSEATAAGVGAGYEAEKHEHGSKATSTAGTGEFSKKEAEKEAKQEKHREKALAKEEKHDGKKHGGILGFLHRDKSDKDSREEQAERQESSTPSLSGAKPAEVGAAGPGAIGINEHEREEHEKHERNRLHKAGFSYQDPPASMMAGDTSYAAAPTSGYASQVTGGTGTTALAQGDSVPGGSHASTLGNKLDPAVADRGDNLDPAGEGYSQGLSGAGGETAGDYPASSGTGQYGSSVANPSGTHGLVESSDTANTTATAGTGQYGSSVSGPH